MNAKYLIADEPRPSNLAKHVVNPQWPMLAQMLSGSWLALPWFVFNSFALGSPNRKQDICWAIASFIGSIFLLLALGHFVETNVLSGIWIPLSFLTIVILRIYIAYRLYFSQSAVFELWQYYGGIEKNGMFLLIISGLIVRPYLASQLSNDFLRIILF